MKEKLKNKKVVYTIIGIISVLLVAVAVTYAYWLVTQTQEGENVITTGCLDITLDGENDITLSNPELSCSDKEEDSLTVENVRLRYPIELITASELKMAGGSNSYLNGCVSHGTSCCWTMSPLESFMGQI